MKKSTKWALSILVVAALAAAATFAIRLRTSGHAPPLAAKPPGPQVRAVPVIVASVVQRDVPIFLEGLGNVTASMTVTVKTQLDGRLDQVLFKEGQAVRRGDLLAQIDPRPYEVQLEQGQGALARDEALLKNAQLTVERDRTLVEKKLIAQQQLDTDVATVGQLEGSVKTDRATIDSARLNLDYARITSPIDGITGIRQVDPGNVVHAADSNGIVVITKLDPVAIVFTLPQDDLTPVREALLRSGTLPVDAYNRDGSALLGSGKLILIDNQINQTTSTIRLKAEVPNPNHLLWPNQFVNARLHLTTRKDALVIPSIALQRGPAGSFVYVVGADSTVSNRAVQVSTTQGDVTIVASGLEPGDRVVTEGQNQLRPGALVSAREVGQQSGTRPESLARDGAQGDPGSVARP
ncbi:MAG TPA: efflux RND transporter periplasmic adaptor subunit [Anaeromyxobacter sp.]|nr:efflux RND transporter periplasmic adaptor subunit [Anaeromyxobacter sp.]